MVKKNRKYVCSILLMIAWILSGERIVSAASCTPTNATINFATSIDPSGSSIYYGTVTGGTISCTKSPATLTFSSASCTGNCQLNSLSPAITFSLGYVPSATYTGTPVSMLYSFPSLQASSIANNAYQTASYTPSGTQYTNNTAITIVYNWSTGSGAGNNGTVTVSIPINSVTATVQSQCASPVNGTMSISIDPSSTATQQPFGVSTPSSVQCTNSETISNITAQSLHGTGATICNPTSGISGMILQSATGKQIPYTFYCNNTITGAGFGSGLGRPLGIGGFVAQPAAQTADYDNGNQYSDLVTLTINY